MTNDALDRLMKHAYADTGGSMRVAQFLLSLWNGYNFKVDMQELLYTDSSVFSDMVELLQYLKRQNMQLSDLVSQSEIDPVIDSWGEKFRLK